MEWDTSAQGTKLLELIRMAAVEGLHGKDPESASWNQGAESSNTSG